MQKLKQPYFKVHRDKKNHVSSTIYKRKNTHLPKNNLTTIFMPAYKDREKYQDLNINSSLIERNEFSGAAEIDLSEDYIEASEILYELIRKGEYSSRMLDVTYDLIRMNPTNYTIWEARFQALRTAGEDSMIDELYMMEDLLPMFLKVYQVWQHRRNIVEELDDSTEELEMTQKVLAIDNKNYHTWVYRRFVLEYFFSHSGYKARQTRYIKQARPDTSSFEDDLQDAKTHWENEIDFTTNGIDEDQRNNSFWSHRYFVLFEWGHDFYKDRTELCKRLQDECLYVNEKIERVPSNPSTQSYKASLEQLRKIYPTEE